MADEKKEVCGSTLDHYPSMPGKLVSICAREPHNRRKWHRNADESLAWKDPKPQKVKSK